MLRRHTIGMVLCGVLSAVSGCGGAADEEAAAVESGATSALVFADCALTSSNETARAECANVDVPLDWGRPEGRRANVFVKRVRGSAPGPHAQMWLLQGGPGSSGQSLTSLASVLVKEDPRFDVYIPDHRGTGRSTHLECPTHSVYLSPAECVAELEQIWGRDGLATFTTTTAARDLGHLVERTRAPGQEVHVYGVSYGTYLAQRYLQLFPEQPTAVTLDGVCQAGLCSLPMLAYWRDRVGKRFLRECSADAFCASKLGLDPEAKVRAAVAVAEAGTCAGLAGMNGALFREILASLMYHANRRVVIPPLVYRTLRCGAEDVAPLRQLVSLVAPQRRVR